MPLLADSPSLDVLPENRRRTAGGPGDRM